MKQTKSSSASPYKLEGRIPLGQAILYGLQHVLAMCGAVRRTAEYDLQPECGSCRNDKDRKSVFHQHGRNLFDSLRLLAKACRACGDDPEYLY